MAVIVVVSAQYGQVSASGIHGKNLPYLNNAPFELLNVAPHINISSLLLIISPLKVLPFIPSMFPFICCLVVQETVYRSEYVDEAPVIT